MIWSASIVPPQAVLFVKASQANFTFNPELTSVRLQHPETKNYDLRGIKYCMAGAAPVSPELTKAFKAVLPNCWIGQGYDELCLSIETVPNGLMLVSFPPIRMTETCKPCSYHLSQSRC